MKNFVMQGFIRVENDEVTEAIGITIDLDSGRTEMINTIGATQEDIGEMMEIFKQVHSGYLSEGSDE